MHSPRVPSFAIVRLAGMGPGQDQEPDGHNEVCARRDH